ncbi:dipeptidase B [Anticarsia gemmatalis]|uniref:dipeptidase B n=1 Tax=Anticarsia gemmatalis TaxID=129554 RepID=UPI003F76D75E
MGGDKSLVVHGVAVRAVSEINSADYDALVLVTAPGVAPPQALEDFVAAARLVDASLDKNAAVLACPRVSGGRLVLAPTGPLTAYDDVRSVGEAALAGVRRAAAAGAVRPALALQPHPTWPNAELVALLGALEALYVPLQIRESFPAQAHGLRALGVYGEGVRVPLDELLRDAAALELSRGVARDIGGADPERMAPGAVARYVQELFAGTSVKVRVLDDAAAIEKNYPLMAAVNRAAATVDRHRGCVIYLEYVPESYERTVMLVGKGVTYDTGGCDIKAGGVMAGMSRDKCGAAAVAGFLRACDLLRPALKVVAALGMVRNSVGEQAYVADELLRSRRGLAVRVGNTDAEGRMVMGDLLAEMAERAAGERAPHLYTVATLTGHAVRAYGEGYTAAVDNHAARGHASALQAAGAALADMLEVSTLRREDLAAHRGRVAGDHVHQADNAASSAMPRGHQAPAAFLLLVAGLEAGALAYTHLDVAGSAGCLPAPPTAAPLLALAAHYGLVRSKRDA